MLAGHQVEEAFKLQEAVDVNGGVKTGHAAAQKSATVARA